MLWRQGIVSHISKSGKGLTGTYLTTIRGQSRTKWVALGSMVDYNNDKIVSNAAHQFFACWRETYSHYLQYLQGVHVFKTVGRKFANLEIPEISMQKRRFPSSKNSRLQNKAKCKTLLWKWVLFTREYKINKIIRFKTESRGNSEMGYLYFMKEPHAHVITSLFALNKCWEAELRHKLTKR